MIRREGFIGAKFIRFFLLLGLLILFVSVFFLRISFSLSLLSAKEKETTDIQNLKKKRRKKEIEKKEKKASKRSKKHKKQAVKKKIIKKKTAKDQKKEGNKKVYLTFDDGPSENTDEILKILDKYNIKATFFVIGKEDEESINRYKKIVEKGHTIGLHSYTHRYKEIYKDLSAFKKDFKRIQNLIYKATGVRSNYYRFPGGTSNTVSPTDMNVFVDYFNRKGIRYYDWNVQCGDAVKVPPNPDTLYKNVVEPILQYHLQSYIVLIHDSVPMKNSVKALPRMIEKLQRENFELLPIDDDTEQIHHKAQKRTKF